MDFIFEKIAGVAYAGNPEIFNKFNQCNLDKENDNEKNVVQPRISTDHDNIINFFDCD